MSIKATCEGCKATFQLKDELAGKKGKCPNCSGIIHIPLGNAEEETPLEGEVKEATNPSTNESKRDAVFAHDHYGIKQKKIAINEKYFIRDKDNNELLFSLRKAYVMRGLFSVLTFIVVLGLFVFLGFTVGGMDNPVPLIMFAVMGAFAAIFMSVFVSPKQHIQFFKDSTDVKGESEFDIKEDSKFQLVNKTYTMLNKEKEEICKFRKNIFTNILRKKWHMEFDGKHLEIKEDSVILGLLRRILPYGGFIRTNFIFVDTETQDNLGIFKRKFELFDNYTLDLSNDTAYRVPRQLSIGMAVLLDTGEKR